MNVITLPQILKTRSLYFENCRAGSRVLASIVMFHGLWECLLSRHWLGVSTVPYLIMAYVDGVRCCIDFAARLGISAPEAIMAKTWEFIALANGDARTPCLSIFEDGKEVCSRAIIPLIPTAVTDEEIDNAVCSISEFLSACPLPLMAVVFGNIEPAEAVKNIDDECRGHQEASQEVDEISAPARSRIH
jgi:hypothetical protein